jgi:WD40 repeat protein
MDANPQATHTLHQWKCESPLINCRFDPTGQYVFAAAEDFSIYRFAMADGKYVSLTGHGSWPRPMVFSKDGQMMVSGGCDHQLIWWPVADAEPKPIRTVKAHRGWIRAMDVSPDGTTIASAGNDNLIKLWNFATGELVATLSGHAKNIYSVAFHPNGKSLLSGDLAGAVLQWEVATGKLERQFDAKPLTTYNTGQRVDYGGIRTIVFNNDQTQIILGGLHKASNPLGAVNEPLLMRFDWESQKLLRSHTIKGVKGIAWRSLIHPQGFLMAVSGGSGGGFLAFWNEDKDEEFYQMKMPNTAREMDLHPDGIQIATAHHDKQLRISLMSPKTP